jgi:hypothetical protein|tara:strand:+ start:343 stop:849 length:507 start_codon:yes stop_codon:yes gene_type:complete
MGLRIIPLDLKEANRAVDMFHRHHKPVVGHRFSLGAVDESGKLVGAAIAGRPIARVTNQKFVLEVTRVATDGTKNACSLLLGAVARAAKNMGYSRVQTTTLQKESGSSLRACGWVCHETNRNGKHWDSRSGRDVDCKDELKVRWHCDFRDIPEIDLFSRESKQGLLPI